MILEKRAFFLLVMLLLSTFLVRTHAEEEAQGIPIIKRPIQEYLPIVEHTCIKHIRAGELEQARANLRVMNQICAGKKEMIEMLEGHVAEFERALAEARRAKEEYLRSTPQGVWVCRPSGQEMTKRQSDFYEKIGKPVSKMLNSLGIHGDMAPLLVAQIVVETGWGRKMTGNNLFNVKGKYQGQSNVVRTHEFDQGGQKIEINDQFRSYTELRDSVNDYLSVLQRRWGESYQQLFLPSPSIEKFIKGLKSGQQGGYATDPLYGNKLRSVLGQVQGGLGSLMELVYVNCL